MKKLLITLIPIIFCYLANGQITKQTQTIKVSGDLSGYSTKSYSDSLRALGYTKSQVDSAINLKLDKSDSTIANRVTANTSNIATNTTAIAGKQNIITNLSDTSKYAKKSDSTIFSSVYQNSLKLKITDTANKWKSLLWFPNYTDLIGTVPTWNQPTTGNAATATKLATVRTLSTTGDVSVSLNFDGSANATATATVNKVDSNKINGVIPLANLPVQNLYGRNGIKTDSTTTPGSITIKTDSTYLDSTVRAIAITKSGVQGLPTYTSQYNAVLNGLKNGDKYKVMYPYGNRLLAVVDTVILPPTPVLNFDWDNSSGTYPVGNFFAHTNTVGDSMIVNWGDGNTTRQIANGTKDFPVSHTYSSSAVFNVKITFTNNTHITNFTDSASGTSALRGGISVVRNVSLLTSLTTLALSNSKIVRFDTITLPNSLAQLYLNKNPLTTFNRASYPTALTTLNLDNTNITALGTTANLPATLTTFSCNNTLMNNAAMNNALVYLDGLTFSGAVNIKLQGYGAPTGAGATAKTSLIGKGNTVTTD